MIPEMVQHAIVTIAAAGAAWVVVRRVVGVVKPAGGKTAGGPTCASCPSAPTHVKRQELGSEAKPLTLIR